MNSDTNTSSTETTTNTTTKTRHGRPVPPDSDLVENDDYSYIIHEDGTHECGRCGREYDSSMAVKSHITQSTICKDTPEIKRRYIEEKESPDSIGEDLGYNGQAVRDHLRALGLTRSRSEATRVAYQTGSLGTNEPDLYPSEDLARVVAESLTDTIVVGYDKNHGYFITLRRVDDKEHHEAFMDSLRGIDLNPSSGTNDDGYYYSVANSMKFYEWWRYKMGMPTSGDDPGLDRDEPDEPNITAITNLATQYPGAFLGAVIDADGSLYRPGQYDSYRMSIGNGHRWVIRLVRSIMIHHGVEPTDIEEISDHENTDHITYVTRISNTEDIERICEVADIRIPRKDIERRREMEDDTVTGA